MIESKVTRLDMETKVCMMAALMDDGGDVETVVSRAIEIEGIAHRRVGDTMRERKNNLSPR